MFAGLFNVFTRVFRAMTRLAPARRTGSTHAPVRHPGHWPAAATHTAGARASQNGAGVGVLAALAAITVAATGGAARFVGNALAPGRRPTGGSFSGNSFPSAPVGEEARVEIRLTSVPAGAAIVVDGRGVVHGDRAGSAATVKQTLSRLKVGQQERESVGRTAPGQVELYISEAAGIRVGHVGDQRRAVACRPS
jgi:hypothetical protein